MHPWSKTAPIQLNPNRIYCQCEGLCFLVSRLAPSKPHVPSGENERMALLF